MFAPRSVLRGPGALARTQRSNRSSNSLSLKSAGLQLEALEQRHLLTATVIAVDTFADTVDPLDGLTSLREAVIQANASPDNYEIQLPAGTYTLTRKGAGEDAALTGDLDILNNGSLKIVGASAETTIIDASGLFDAGLGYGDRIFDVKGGVFEVEGLTLTGGRHPTDGGAIFSSGDLTIKNSKLVDNSAIRGGAILHRGVLSVVDSTFAGNSATNGGAIWNRGFGLDGVISGSTFTGNSATWNGAAIHFGGVSQQIIDSLFSGNTGGGAIYSEGIQMAISGSIVTQNQFGIVLAGGDMTIADSTISENTDRGVYVDLQSFWSTANLIISGSTISNNAGGGIYTRIATTIVDSVISGNQGEGGIYREEVLGTIVSVIRSTISGNRSTSAGGGIRNIGQMLIVDSTISGNHSASQGGGIFSASTLGSLTENLTISNSTISGNSASRCGGIYNFGVLTIENSTISQNTGGGILDHPAISTPSVVKNSIIAGNLFNGAARDWEGKAMNAASSYNLIGSPAAAGGLTHGTNGNIVGDGLGNPLDVSTVLDTTLADNGGPTLTHALVLGSPAVNAGDPLFDPNDTDPPLLYDQRGPGFDRVKFGRLDIGAFEGLSDPANVILVNTFEDVVDDDGLWSLREAVIYANANPGNNRIQLPAGTYILTRKGADEDAALTGDLDILNNGSLKIVGAGAETTIIDASGLFDAELGYGDRIFDVHAGVIVEMEGLALTGGSTPTSGSNSNQTGGAIRSVGNLTIHVSVLSHNVAQSSGGGIFSDSTGVLSVRGSTFTNNSSGRDGGAIYTRGEATVSDSEISNNSAARDGGAVLANGKMTMSDSAVFNNTAAQGGGIYADTLQSNGGRISVTRSTISGNIATGAGAGGVFNNADMTISDTTISGNHTPGTGGGIVNWQFPAEPFAKLRIVNSTISGNTASSGGAIRSAWRMVIENSTIVGNTGNFAGGVLAGSVASLLNNSIIAGNSSGSGNDWAGLPLDPASSFNLIGDPNFAGGLMHGTNGNIVGDGLGNVLDVSTVLDTTLADNGGPTLTHALVPGSPAMNAGGPLFDPNATDPPLLYDQRGPSFDRVKFGRLDIGAFEANHDPKPVGGMIVVTTFDDVVADDGLWSLREAVIYANAHPEDNEIHLPAGTYSLTRQRRNEESSFWGDLDIVNNGSVRIVGAGSEVTTIDANGLFNASTGGDRIFDLKPGTVTELSGITLTGGRSPGVGTIADRSGGAVRLSYGQLTLSDSKLVGNQAVVLGGAIFNIGGQLLIVGSTIAENAASAGAGLAQDIGVPAPPVGETTILNSRFLNNKAISGGAISLNYGRLSIIDSTLQGNQATSNGGAISAITPESPGGIPGATLDILRSTILENSSMERGGGIFLIRADVTLRESTLADNSALEGGAIYAIASGSAAILNSTISRNVARYDGGGVYTEVELAVRSSTITGNRSGADGNSFDKGGGVSIHGGAFASFDHSLVAGNFHGVAPGIAGDIGVSGGQIDPASAFNLIGDPNSSGGLTHGTGGNIVGDGFGNPLDVSTVLDTTLADNGGPTLTHALVLGSPAINAGDPLFDPNATSPPILFDQRGAGYARVTGGRVDIGAFEFGSTFENVVAGRHIFYDNSIFDGNTPGPNAADALAIATDKQPLLPGGGLATAANATSYVRGINGIMIDIAGSHPDITANDFVFRVGNNNAPDSWALAPEPASILVLAGQGTAGADRVVITWPSGSITNTWLQVQVLASANTGLAATDVFYWGNKIGDSFTNPGAEVFQTNTTDAMQVFATLGTNKPITDLRDYNRDGQVTTADSTLVFANLGSIVRLNIPAAAPLALPATSALPQAAERKSAGGLPGRFDAVATALAAPSNKLDRFEPHAPRVSPITPAATLRAAHVDQVLAQDWAYLDPSLDLDNPEVEGDEPALLLVGGE